MADNRAVSVAHAEYHLIEHIIENVELSRVKRSMCDDKHSTKRFDQACTNILQYLENMMGRRMHKLPKTHPDYKERGE